MQRNPGNLEWHRQPRNIGVNARRSWVSKNKVRFGVDSNKSPKKPKVSPAWAQSVRRMQCKMQQGLIAAGPRWPLGPFPPSPPSLNLGCPLDPKQPSSSHFSSRLLHATAVRYCGPRRSFRRSKPQTLRLLDDDTKLSSTRLMAHSSSDFAVAGEKTARVNKTSQDSTIVSPPRPSFPLTNSLKLIPANHS